MTNHWKKYICFSLILILAAIVHAQNVPAQSACPAGHEDLCHPPKGDQRPSDNRGNPRNTPPPEPNATGAHPYHPDKKQRKSDEKAAKEAARVLEQERQYERLGYAAMQRAFKTGAQDDYLEAVGNFNKALNGHPWHDSQGELSNAMMLRANTVFMWAGKEPRQLRMAAQLYSEFPRKFCDWWMHWDSPANNNHPDIYKGDPIRNWNQGYPTDEPFQYGRCSGSNSEETDAIAGRVKFAELEEWNLLTYQGYQCPLPPALTDIELCKKNGIPFNRSLNQ
jgi:hypothetical protein